jgi:hypothetical protein
MELSKENEQIVQDFSRWLDSCNPDDFLPPDCGVGAENIEPKPILPPLEVEVGAAALLQGCEVESPDILQSRGIELCPA